MTMSRLDFKDNGLATGSGAHPMWGLTGVPGRPPGASYGPSAPRRRATRTACPSTEEELRAHRRLSLRRTLITFATAATLLGALLALLSAFSRL
jgi:hypothetical protein